MFEIQKLSCNDVEAIKNWSVGDVMKLKKLLTVEKKSKFERRNMED